MLTGKKNVSFNIHCTQLLGRGTVLLGGRKMEGQVGAVAPLTEGWFESEARLRVAAQKTIPPPPNNAPKPRQVPREEVAVEVGCFFCAPHCPLLPMPQRLCSSLANPAAEAGTVSDYGRRCDTVHMPSCLHALFRVARPLNSKWGGEGTISWGMFPQRCKDTTVRSCSLLGGRGG